MAGEDPDDYDESSETPWYNRTPNVIGASVAGIAAIGIIIAAVSFVARQFDEPTQAPLNFVDPTFTATASNSSTTTTTATITSTSPPVTTDMDGPSSTTPSSSDTSSTETSSGPNTAWTRPYTPPSGEESAPSTTRRGPRTNVTRTLYPQP
jgi:cytoskeletal protein RodZ